MLQHRIQDGVVRAWMLAAAVVTLPPTLLHEVTHAVVAAPWAHELVVVVQPRAAGAWVGIDWREGVPGWVVVAAHYGPTVLGGAIGVVGAFLLVLGWWPEGGRAWLVSGVLGVWWAVYTWPSDSDRQLPDDGATAD